MNFVFSQPERFKQILALSLPIIGGMASQNVLNLVDTAMVGRLGDNALAAVGLGGFVTFMCQSVLLGVSTGVQAIAARRVGQGRLFETALPLNTGLLVVALAGVPLAAVLHYSAPSFYPYIIADPAVQAEGLPYLQIRLLAIPFVAMNFAFRGYWNGVNLSRLYMNTLLLMHSINIILNYLLIFGKLGFPEMGVRGAALASALAFVLGSMTYFFLGLKYAREGGFLKVRPSRLDITSLIKLSVPNSIQQLFFSAGFTALFYIIGRVGTSELAAANVLINITLVAILPGIGMGMAAATLVSQALGRNQSDDAHAWAWQVVQSGVALLTVLGIPMWLFTARLLGIFIHDEHTLQLAVWPMRLSGLIIGLEGIGLVLMHALLGAGAARNVMFISIGLQWFLFLPGAYILGPVMGYGLLVIWIAQGAYRLLQSAFFMAVWQKKGWSDIVL